MANKKYYWLKLKTDFFNQREVKKLRKIAGGDTYTIIYLKLQLLSAKTDGVIKFEGTEKNLTEQLELELDEDFDNIQVTLSFLQANGLIEQINDNDFLMPKVCDSIGKEGTSAERVRKHRENKALQCNKLETKCNTEKEKEKEKEKREELKKEKEIIIDENQELATRTIDYLNKVTGKSFKHGKGNLKEILMQIKKGATEKELAHVINVKCQEWKDNQEMKKHLNPVTLFREANFDKYLNQEMKVTQSDMISAVYEARKRNANG